MNIREGQIKRERNRSKKPYFDGTHNNHKQSQHLFRHTFRLLYIRHTAKNGALPYHLIEVVV